MNKLPKYLCLFTVGGIVYYFIEVMYRGYSHFSMFAVGGICFIVLGLINEVLKWSTPLYKQALIGAFAITAIEFVSGCIVNLYFKWNVWDYSNLPLNILGQVCPQFFFMWIFISIIGIVLDDYLRYRFFQEEKPRYKLF